MVLSSATESHSMPIFLYIERGSFVHRLNPTVKVFALFIMFWSVYWVDHPLALLPLGLVMVAMAQLTGSWPNFYRLRWLFILVIFFTTLAWMVFYRKGPALINTPLIHLSRASLVFGLGRGLKLAELLATSVLFLSTTKVEEFTAGLAAAGRAVPGRLRDHAFVPAGAAVHRLGADRGAGAEPARLRFQSRRSAGAGQALRAGGDSGFHGRAAQGQQDGDGAGGARLRDQRGADQLHRLSDSRARPRGVRGADRARRRLFSDLLHRLRRDFGEIADHLSASIGSCRARRESAGASPRSVLA